jgi:anaerobic magnesium-protoporphyrin IX monomethyl ester cyclase
MGFFPPTGLEYIASSLATCVPRVTIADLRHDRTFRPEPKLIEFIRQKGIDLLAVSVNWEFRFDEVLELVSRLSAEICTIVGGQEATVRVDEIMNRCPNVDYVARGEGEEIVIEFASGKPIQEITSLSHRVNGSIVHNKNRIVKPMEMLLERDRSLRRVSYGIRRYGVNFIKGGLDTVITSRGCPFNCKFCSFSLNPLGKKREYDERSAESVFQEVRSLDADIIFFVDDNFFVNQKRIERLCDLLIENRVKKRLFAQARVEIAQNPLLLEKLVKAGFKMFLLGIESAQDWILEDLNKGFTTAQIREYFKVLRKYDIYYHGYFIIGNIGETEEEMLEIPQFANELELDSISYLKLRAYRYTPINDKVKTTPGYHTTSRGFVYSDRYSMDDLRRIGKSIRHEFYTLKHLAKALKKFVRIGFATRRDVAALIFRIPLAHYNRRRKKRRQVEALKKV